MQRRKFREKENKMNARWEKEMQEKPSRLNIGHVVICAQSTSSVNRRPMICARVRLSTRGLQKHSFCWVSHLENIFLEVQKSLELTMSMTNQHFQNFSECFLLGIMQHIP